MSLIDTIIGPVQRHHPNVQAIYLFGSWGTDGEWPTSDVDIALLLPHDEAKQIKMLALTPLHQELEQLLAKPVDLINLRRVPTVLQKEVLEADRRIFCGNLRATEEFEMLAMSYYQKLNEERREILAEFWRTGRAYAHE